MVESLTMIPSKKDMENISGLLYPKKECVVRTRTGKIQTTIIFSDEERKMYNILICDDEKDIVSALKIYLKTSGYNIYEAYNGKEALEQIKEHDIHLVLMDIMMPEMDGITAMLKIREETNLPFNPVEVIARVKSQLRRYMQLGSGQIKKDAIVIGGIELNDNSKQVTVDGELVSLTPTEYDILRLLMEHPGQVFSPRDIYKEVWKETPLGAEGSVAVHIRHLREKIEINPGEPRYIKVIWGRGYKMEYQ